MAKSKGRTLLQTLKALMQRLRRKSPPPGDPYAERLVPVRRGPKGRSGAAVAEPEEDSYRAYRPRSQ
jgi:hypothetical protein